MLFCVEPLILPTDERLYKPSIRHGCHIVFNLSPRLAVCSTRFEMEDPSPPLISKCWFGDNRPSSVETKPRSGSFDLAALACCDRRTTISDALKEYKGKTSLYGFNSQLDLLLFRANGEVDYDETEALDREICSSHFSSLLSNWSKSKHLHRSKKSGNGSKFLCSLPSSYHPKGRCSASDIVNKEQATAWMELNSELIHPGIAICATHNTHLSSNKRDQLLPRDTAAGDCLDYQFDDNSNDDNDASDYNSSILILLASICKIIGISRLIGDERWDDITPDSRTRKRRAFRTLIMELARCIAGEKFSDLMGDLDVNNIQPRDTGDDYLESIAKAHSNTKCKKEKLQLISLLLNVKGLCKKKICNMLSITRHQIRKTVAFCKGLYKFEVHRRVKYSKDKVVSFISFLARSNLIASLPFGDCETILSDGTRIKVASITRLFSYSRIIREYFKELKRSDAWVMKLSRTTLYLILRAIAKRKNKQLFCVDEYMGEAYEAFDNMDTTIHKWLEFGKITGEEITVFKQGLRVIKTFLETDFRSHVQATSEIASHCIQYALSEKDDNKFSRKCNHHHDLICLQCERVDTVLSSIVSKGKEIGEYANSSFDPNVEELIRLFEVVNLASESIHKYRRHLLRSAASDEVRFDIQNNLEENDCLLTLDFAMKLLSSSALETQSGFFAKKGTSFHIAHALIRQSGNLKHHVFAHLIQTGEQDNESVCAIIRHIMEELRRLGIKRVSIRSDNAATYKAASVISTLQSLCTQTPIIVRYSFSETQYGKGPCDRDAAYLKRSITWWNESGKKSKTVEEMYAALTDNTVKGCSIYLVDVVTTGEEKKKKKTAIPGITSFFDFHFMNDKVVANKYAGIGEGLAFKSSALDPNKASLKIVKQGGFLDNADCWVTLNETKENDDNKEDMDMVSFENCFPCSVKDCTKSFLTIEDLDDHIYRQDHSFAITKESILDVAKKEIAAVIETEEAARIAVDESTILSKRCDKMTHERGWAIKEGRAPRMNGEIQQFAENFFYEHRAQGKRACPSACSELIKNEKKANGAYRFPLALCPSEKTLSSSFGTWENRRLRPKLTATRGGGRKKKTTAKASNVGSIKRKYESSDDEGGHEEEDEEEMME